MPGYGMPTGTKGLLPWTWAEERLRTSHNYYVMTVRPDGTPHAMPVWGIWVDNRFYFSTGAKSRQGAQPRRQSVVRRLHRAIGGGGGRRRHGVGDRFAARIAELSPHYAKKYKGFTLDPKMGPIFEVRPKVAFGLRESTFKSTTRWTF